ncbi:Putative Zn peptidase [Rheinheimera sp. A13L]|uniref:XRE family transcriptional regulator n=1 Tax=Rheinheimera sp. A13L TaxID=506534 RepID=UPI00021253A8|nr:XRE family transcriptional regulator [Rheinheimera sp. A13L]EGM79132.1 Putative Zn peptidase [Rheinheimera sp. A13L]
MSNAKINKAMLTWARERSGYALPEFAHKLNVTEQKVSEWEAGEREITFVQAMAFADKAHVPFGFLFLSQPPVENLPIPDLRTVDSAELKRPSAELIDLLKNMLECQDWYRDYARNQLLQPIDVVGSFRPEQGVAAVVADMRTKLNIPPHPKRGNWTDYYRDLVQRIETLGILVMRQSSLGHHSRPFSVEEFRGFAMCDEFAPIIFVNHADAPGARLFTLIHELCHIWIGQTGISDGDANNHRAEERFCNAVAAEFLVPTDEFQALWRSDYDHWQQNLPDLEAHFHVSPWALARKALTLELISQGEYGAFIKAQIDAFKEREASGSGPGYFKTKKAQISQLFSKAVVSEALNGKLLLRDAGWMLGMKPASVAKFAQELGL